MPKHILLVQLKRAGDVILTTPVFSAIKASLPEAELDFLVDKPFAPLLEHNPFLRQVIAYNRARPWQTIGKLRQARYDWIIDFQSSPRSVVAGVLSAARRKAGYRVPFWGRFFQTTVQRPGGELAVPEGKMTLIRSLLPQAGPAGARQVFVSDDERQWVCQNMSLPRAERVAVGLIPTHRRASRRWGADSFVEVGRHFLQRGFPVWLFWGPGEESYVAAMQKKIPNSIMIPPASLRQMAALLQCCRVVVTNDNGPMHVAEAVDTPTVTVYGPTHPHAWNAGGLKHRIVQAAGLPCLGCDLNECPYEHECMTQVTVSDVIRHAEASFGAEPASV